MSAPGTRSGPASDLVLGSSGALDLLSGPSATYLDCHEWWSVEDMSSGAVAIRPDLVDLMMDLYCDWRTECAQVQAAYEHFSGASPSDRALAFAGYTAALDQEQAACEAYAEQLSLITSHITGDLPSLPQHANCGHP
jgi:hypothetical protein